MNTLSGYSKNRLTNDNLLTAAGGHIPLGNASGNVPISNGTKNVNLNADKLDDYHYDDIVVNTIGYNHIKGATTSKGWYRIAQLISYGSFLLSISGTFANINSTAASFIINKSYQTVRISQIGKASNAQMITKIRIVKDATTGSKMYVEAYNNYNSPNSEEFSYRILPLEHKDGAYNKGVTMLNAALTTESLSVAAEISILTEYDVNSAVSSSEASNSDTVDNYHIEVTSSPGTDSSTLYFVL